MWSFGTVIQKGAAENRICDNSTSKTDDRGCKCRKTAGEESPGFAGQDAG